MTAGPDKVKQTDKVMLTSLTQKYKLAKGYKHQVKSLTSGSRTYILNRDFRVVTDKKGDSYIVWTFLDDPTHGVGLGLPYFPPSRGDAGGPYNFQDKTLYPNGDLDDDYFWAFESYANTVNFVNGGLEAFYQSSYVGMISPYTRTEHANNIRFGYSTVPISSATYPPATLKVTLRPAYRTGAISPTATGYGLFCGEGMILYGTPCDFIGIGGYGQGVVDGCPSPAGTGGALTQYNPTEGQARIYSGLSSSTLKVFRVQSTLDGVDVTATNVANVGGNIRVTTSGAHGYLEGDIVYMTGGSGCRVVGTGILPMTVITLNEEGFRVTAVPSPTTFEVDAPDPTVWDWTFGAPWPTIQKVSSCTTEYWDSGKVFPNNDIQFLVRETGEEGSESFRFFYNLTGVESDWKALGPEMSQPLGYSYAKVILGSYTGGHFNLSGSVGPYNASHAYDGTNHMTQWRKLEGESIYYTWDPGDPTPYYNIIPLFDEEGSQ